MRSNGVASSENKFQAGVPLLDTCEFSGGGEFYVARRAGAGGYGTGCQEGIFEEPTDFQQFNPPYFFSLSLSVEPGRKGQVDDHRSRTCVCHRADVSASSTRLSGEVASLQLIVSDFVMPTGLLSKSHSCSPYFYLKNHVIPRLLGERSIYVFYSRQGKMHLCPLLCHFL